MLRSVHTLLASALVLALVAPLTAAPPTIEMTRIAAGTTSPDNGQITVEQDFYIGTYHVTQAQFEAIMGFNPSTFGGRPDNPVEMVTWQDALLFCNKLSEAHGLTPRYQIHVIARNARGNILAAAVSEHVDANGFRLPTAAEHEYAARGGRDGKPTRFAGSDNLDEVGWYWDNSDTPENKDRASGRGTMPVGQKMPNELGLYDMSGNVWDWTFTKHDGLDWWFSRGGSWFDAAERCELTLPRQRGNRPGYHNYNIGFRVARDVPANP